MWVTLANDRSDDRLISCFKKGFLSCFFFEKIFFLSLYRINFTVTGLGRLLLLSFLPIRCVRSRSLCVSSISNFSLKISRARSSAFSWFPSVFQWIRKQFFEIPFLFQFLIPNVIDSLRSANYFWL